MSICHCSFNSKCPHSTTSMRWETTKILHDRVVASFRVAYRMVRRINGWPEPHPLYVQPCDSHRITDRPLQNIKRTHRVEVGSRRYHWAEHPKYRAVSNIKFPNGEGRSRSRCNCDDGKCQKLFALYSHLEQTARDSDLFVRPTRTHVCILGSHWRHRSGKWPWLGLPRPSTY